MTVIDSLDVSIRVGTVSLDGVLATPTDAVGLVVFAHGSGSSRFSPRNRNVACALNGVGFATLLLDLLTVSENERDELTAEFRFDIPLLARRLTFVVNWLAVRPTMRPLPIGLFGASTGAAAALIAAAMCPELVRAVVSRGGRPDLADTVLEQVCAPTLLIVGGEDTSVIALNEQAAGRLYCPHELAIVPGATHLFEEWGALDRVTELTADWFNKHLVEQAPLAKSK